MAIAPRPDRRISCRRRRARRTPSLFAPAAAPGSPKPEPGRRHRRALEELETLAGRQCEMERPVGPGLGQRDRGYSLGRAGEQRAGQPVEGAEIRQGVRLRRKDRWGGTRRLIRLDRARRPRFLRLLGHLRISPLKRFFQHRALPSRVRPDAMRPARKCRIGAERIKALISVNRYGRTRCRWVRRRSEGQRLGRRFKRASARARGRSRFRRECLEQPLNGALKP